MPAPCETPVHWAAGSDGETNFGMTSLAAPRAVSSRVAKYSFTARLDLAGSRSLRQSSGLPPLVNFAQIGLIKEGTDAPSWTTKASSNRSYRQPIQPALNGP